MLFFLPNFRYYFEQWLDDRYPDITWSFRNKVYLLAFDGSPFVIFGSQGVYELKQLAIHAVLESLTHPTYLPPKFARRILDTPDHAALATLRTTLETTLETTPGATPGATPEPEKAWFWVSQHSGQRQGSNFFVHLDTRGIEQIVIAVRIRHDFEQSKAILADMVRHAKRHGIREVTVSVRSLANLLATITQEEVTKERAGAVMQYMLQEDYAKANGNWRSRGSDLIFAKFD